MSIEAYRSALEIKEWKFLPTWNASFKLCIRIRSLSFDSNRRRFLSLAFNVPFFRRAIEDEVKYVALRRPRQFP